MAYGCKSRPGSFAYVDVCCSQMAHSVTESISVVIELTSHSLHELQIAFSHIRLEINLFFVMNRCARFRFILRHVVQDTPEETYALINGKM